MNQREIANTINELIDISVKNERFVNDSKLPSKSFGIGEGNVSFIGFDEVSKYQTGLEHLYQQNQEVEQTISLKKFESSLIDLIRTLRDSSSKCEYKDFKNLTAKLLEPENQESEILYELFGCEMQSDNLELGDFTLYNFPKAENLLIKKYPPLQYREIYFNRRKSDILLGVKVKARENNKSVELADELVETFENVMNYMIADLSHQRSVGIFNFRGWKITRRVICNNSSMGFHGSNDISLPVKIEDPFFQDDSQGNDKIWQLITKSNKSEIEKRLLQAIEWIGKGVYDKDKSKSLVQLVFAIEGMLQHDHKTLITPSIVSQLSDWLAFIIHDDATKRRQIAKYFKQTYRKRSAIVHGGDKAIDIKDVQIALQISKLMVIAFLTTDPFNKMKTVQKLNEYITELKFK
ncbi:hypothetical protein [Flagellimonas halotolerans]|uniref:Apea-like HEPN domain-containing protein n=1 Tax=Flagellimonas halotolerans TaxID=3112164 RepID=A0ABU6IR07_9FLAO|nr:MULTISPECIES: hypothetical protein [unclassified Allomuricauda]MEC3965583.1 hypothetical protein [Muricauda sp. SYSU M86414]MEC4265449.1 hypothetical protein [Muricauda sp. SYSU M84420]